MAPVTNNDPVAFYGFTAVPRDPDVLFKDHPTASGANPKQDEFKVNDFPIPGSEVARRVREFAKKELNEHTFNHSHRVYVYGLAVARTHFPEWSFDEETWYLACILHDIGTADKFLLTTKMSFEFKGAIVARESVLQAGGVEDQADSVCDAIVRHQDIFVKGGNITMVGQLLQLATIIDNVGLRANLLHRSLIASTCAKYRRNGWSEVFAKSIEKEEGHKPWCHTTTFEKSNWKPGEQSNFATDVRNNQAMKEFD